MYISGSVTSNDFNDVDILISFKEISIEKYTGNYLRLREELEMLFNQKVNLLTDRSGSSSYFIQSVEKTKRLLYAV